MAEPSVRVIVKIVPKTYFRTFISPDDDKFNDTISPGISRIA